MLIRAWAVLAATAAAVALMVAACGGPLSAAVPRPSPNPPPAPAIPYVHGVG